MPAEENRMTAGEKLLRRNAGIVMQIFKKVINIVAFVEPESGKGHICLIRLIICRLYMAHVL